MSKDHQITETAALNADHTQVEVSEKTQALNATATQAQDWLHADGESNQNQFKYRTYGLTIPNAPTVWQRAATNRFGTFNPHAAKLKVARNLLKAQWLEEYPDDPVPAGPVSVSISYHMPMAASWPVAKKAKNLGTAHWKDPDLDNLLKFTLDALKGTAYIDDNQVYQIDQTAKFYSVTPCTDILITTQLNFENSN